MLTRRAVSKYSENAAHGRASWRALARKSSIRNFRSLRRCSMKCGGNLVMKKACIVAARRPHHNWSIKNSHSSACFRPKRREIDGR
jgi:hypothetical protein